MEKILFADDDIEVQEIVHSILAKAGYEVIPAKDGNEAVALTRKDKPDLIILDYVMPGLNGIEVIKALKGDPDTKSTPIMMVTAYPNEKEAGLSAGAVDFITKPVDKMDLLLRIKSILKVRHITNELQRLIAYIKELES